MSNFEKMKGAWKYVNEIDSDDYRASYEISGSEERPHVSAIDMSDGEVFEISDMNYENEILTFTSLMPSTARKGLNRFTVNESGEVTCEFTFTVVEQLEKIHT